jgi:Holliday junction resolvase RusA-like endonuclease
VTELCFTVHGKAEPAGSKRAFAIKRGGVPTGRVAVVDANPKAKSWQHDVKHSALEAMTGAGLVLVAGPVNVSMTFYTPHPKSHYGTGRNATVLKPSAPRFPTGRPDSLKLARGTEDALTGIVWRDDAQVVDLDVHKRYGCSRRCEIVVRFNPPISAA